MFLKKTLNGILNLNKPVGRTSFSIVAAVKRLSGEKHAGHAGTLDPIASGVLPVFIGRATRFIEYLMDTSKTYRAEIQLGVKTDTYDAEGKIIGTAPISHVSKDLIESTLKDFVGNITQVPPVYSALKINGKPMYELARAGIPVNPEGRTVVIHSIELLDWSPPVAGIRVLCGKGTYIRSLANDLGEKLGCGAMMKSLVRESYGPFDLKDSFTPEFLQQAASFRESSRVMFSPLIRYSSTGLRSP